jgi:hypothetical protein
MRCTHARHCLHIDHRWQIGKRTCRVRQQDETGGTQHERFSAGAREARYASDGAGGLTQGAPRDGKVQRTHVCMHAAMSPHAHA